MADRQYVERALLDPSHEMVAGYLELMPSYRGELQGEKLTRLVDYLLEGAGDAAPPPASSVSPSAASASAAMVDPRATRPGPNASGNTTSSASSPSSTLPAATLEVDPVCNMDVRVVDGTPQATHEGHTYHFCSEGCRERFAKDPSKFLPQK